MVELSDASIKVMMKTVMVIMILVPWMAIDDSHNHLIMDSLMAKIRMIMPINKCLILIHLVNSMFLMFINQVNNQQQLRVPLDGFLPHHN